MDGCHKTDDTRPLVSVIVRTYAGRRHLLMECLRSIDAQEYRNIEIVVIEDGSNSSQACVEQYRAATDLRVQYHSIAKQGRCAAGNKGLKSASGSLLNFLDDDDQFYPNHVGLLAARLRSRPDLVAAYTQAMEVPSSIQSLDPLVYTEQPGRRFRGGPFSLGRLWCQNFLPIQSVMFRRKLFLLYGGFDLEMDRLEDWNLWSRYFTIGDVEFIDEATSFFRVPISSMDQLHRKAMIDNYYSLALRKQRELYAQMGSAEVRALSREIGEFGLSQVPIPSSVRRWIDGSPVCQSVAFRSMALAKRFSKFLRRMLANTIQPKTDVAHASGRDHAAW